ncbi:MAG: Ezrin/radixin/moesin family protein [Cytophagaceae bacterium]
MKTKLLNTVLGIFLLSATAVFAQDKNQEKEWAKKLKTVKPLEYKALVEDKDRLQSQVSECQNSKSSLKSEIASKDEEIARLKKELEDAKAAAATPVVQTVSNTTNTKTPAKKQSSTVFNSSKAVPVAGVVYKVQIGSFKSKDLTKYFDNNPNFSGEVDHDGSKKYTLGVFSDYWEADNFKKALREMGVKGAWVVAYKDGKRVNMKDVLEGAL